MVSNVSDIRIILTTLAISIPLYVASSIYGQNPTEIGRLTKQAQIDGLTKKVQECEKMNDYYKMIIDSKKYKEYKAPYK